METKQEELHETSSTTKRQPAPPSSGRKTKVDHSAIRTAFDRHLAAGLKGNALNQALAREFGFTPSAANNHVYQIRKKITNAEAK